MWCGADLLNATGAVVTAEKLGGAALHCTTSGRDLLLALLPSFMPLRV
jgi:acetyl-CoA carboxylase carboxyltransferase component